MTRRRPVAAVDGQGALFGPDPTPAPAGPAAPEPLPDGQPSRTRARVMLRRQDEALAAGWHPLSLTSARGLRLHPEAAPAGDRAAPGRRCGGCRFRAVINTGHARSFPKCLHPDPDARPAGGWPRQNNGDGTDVRTWWPGCTDHETAQEHGGTDDQQHRQQPAPPADDDPPPWE